MRSAARLFDPDAADLPAELHENLRWLARALGKARAWDVIVEETLPGVIAAVGPQVEDGGRRMLKTAVRARDRAFAHGVAAVSSRRYAQLVLDAARWSMTNPAGADANTSSLAATVLDRAADRLFRNLRSFRKLDRRQRHRVRILAKRLRYALDLLAATLPANRATEYIDALAELQASLGELTDAYAAADLLEGRLDDRASLKALTEWVATVEPDLVNRAARQLAAIARRPRPWSAQ